MVTFSILPKFRIPPAGSLRRRRLSFAARRLTAALCAGLALLFAIEAVVSQTGTAPVAVAARPIARGEIIGADDVEVVRFPVAAVTASMTDSIDELTGSVAYIDIGGGDPVLTSMTRAAPLVPPGNTVVEVRLASALDELAAGDHVKLVSALGCADDAHSGDEGRSENDTPTGASPSYGAAATCVLADDALVMGVNEADPDAESGYGTVQRKASFAMPADAAVRVMQSQEAGAIVAVMR